MTKQSDSLPADLSRFELRPYETVGETIARIRNVAEDSKQLGTWFEYFFMECAKRLPELEVDKIWTWAEWPERRQITGRGANDKGIDLVARLKSGRLVAIQCKFYRDANQPHDIGKRRRGRKVDEDGVDRFIREARPDWFQVRWVVSTSRWTQGAEDAIQYQTPRVIRIDFLDYSDRTFEQISNPVTRVPSQLQQVAIDNTFRGLTIESNDRGRLVMACGTGKTYVSLQVAEKLLPKGGRVLFAAPSISLVSQARKEWLNHQAPNVAMSALVVCSDATAGGGGGAGPDDVTSPVTTDPEEIAQYLRSTQGVQVVFSTYHSLGRVVEAQRLPGVDAFDLAVADEAHRTTGAVRQDAEVDFQLFHDRDQLRARKRLYMTGTPRIYTARSKKSFEARNIRVTDMGDQKTYGPELHRVKYEEAVKAGQLSDYKVVLLGIHGANLSPYLRETARSPLGIRAKVDVSDVARLVGTALAMNGFVRGSGGEVPAEGLPRTIGYASTIPRSRWYRDTFHDPRVREIIAKKYAESDRQAKQMHAVHLDGTQSAITRAVELRNLNAAPRANEARLITNVRVLSEGVDVPALDAISFLDPKQSHIEILQSFGRVMRTAPGKEYGYIIVPVYVPDDVDSVAETLARRQDAYKAVGEVMLALQHHDERLSPSTLSDHVIICEPEPPKPPPVDGEHSLSDFEQDFLFREVDPDEIYMFVGKNTGLGSKGEETAQTIENEVIRAASHLKEDVLAVTEIRKTIDIPETTTDLATATEAALLIFNACLIHKRLKTDTEGADLLVDINFAKMATDPVDVLLGPWLAILKKDFEPIFRPALSVLEALPRSAPVKTAIHILAECAANVFDDLGELGYDHAGPLYHRILSGTKSQGYVDTTALESTGAYYTLHIPALMLAGLALPPVESGFWADKEAVRNLRILDPACGTGTILMAAMKIIKDRAIAAGSFSEQELPELHRHLVMHGIRGLDISYQATQFAASNLFLGAPSVDYETINLHTLDYGWSHEEQIDSVALPSDDMVRLGSVELLVDAISDRRPDLLGNAKNAPLKSEIGVPTAKDTDIRDVDVVLTNPPFTNNAKRAKVLGKKIADLMQAREATTKKKVQKIDSDAANAISSDAGESFFAPLSEALVDEHSGVMAQVMPFTACTGADALHKRKFLASRFHIEKIVTNHLPESEGFNFSIGTKIHESLLICRRRNGNNMDADTQFVSIREMPETSEDVDRFLASIATGVSSEWCNIYGWPRKRVVAGDWSPAQWYDGELAQVAFDLTMIASLKPAGELASIGPTGRRVSEAFVSPANFGKSEIPRNAHTYPLMWHHKTNVRRTMAAKPDFNGVPKECQSAYAEKLWKESSQLLFPSRVRTTNVNTPSVFTSEPVLGMAWVPVIPNVLHKGDPTATMKAWCAFMNSTVGAMFMLNARSKILTYPSYSKKYLKSIPLPNPSKCDLSPLVLAYENHRHAELKPWAQMDTDKVRAAIDDAVVSTIRLDGDVAEWRRRIAREPTVSDRRPEIAEAVGI